MTPMNEAFSFQQSAFSFAGWTLLLAGAALVAIVMGVSAYLAGSHKRFSFRGVGTCILAWVWAVPVLAVLGYFAVDTVESFQRGTSPASGGESSPPVIELGEPAAGDGFASSANRPETDDDAALPAWVREGRVENGSTTLVVLKSQQFATVEEAERQVLDEAVRQVRLDFHQAQPDEGPWTVPVEVIRTHAIRQRYVQPIERQSGNFTFNVHRVYVQLELSLALRAELYPVWREQIVSRRLWTLGSLLGVVTLVLGTSAAYLRLDTLTRGLYRGRLKLAAASLVVAGGAAAAALL